MLGEILKIVFRIGFGIAMEHIRLISEGEQITRRT